MNYGLFLKSLNKYFSSFLPSYLENAVPTNASFPYLTYSLSFSNEWQDNLIQVRIWTKDKNGLMDELVNKTEALLSNVGHGVLIEGTEGNLWIKPGEPLVQYVADPDPTIKVNYINLIINAI